MKILKILSNSKAINIIALIEIILHAAFHVIGSKTAKWHFICWMFWLVILTALRFYYFKTLRITKKHSK